MNGSKIRAKQTREREKLDNLLEQLATISGSDPEELKERAHQGSKYTEEELLYETQAVLNFFDARIAPFLQPREQQPDFERRFQGWRIKTCRGCDKDFAYAWSYEGVTCCSLECVEAELAKIGVKFTWHKDLKKRYGSSYPAIVPSSAFESLRTAYEEQTPDVFSSYESSRPIPQPDQFEVHMIDNHP